MEDIETARMRKYGESKTTRIMMATVPRVTSGLGLRKFQADGFLLTRVTVTRLRGEQSGNRWIPGMNRRLSSPVRLQGLLAPSSLPFNECRG